MTTRSLQEQIDSMRESFSNRIASLEQKVRELQDVRSNPATKKELRDYIAWSMAKRIQNRNIRRKNSGAKVSQETVNTA